MNSSRSALLTVPLLWAILSLPSSAVIVGGTLGTGNNNNTQAGLDSYLAINGYNDFLYWDNLVRVADASGIYLGHNASTLRGWVLSANHVTTPSNITVTGNVYTVTGTGTQVGSSDLKLYEIGGGGADPPLPSLPLVTLAGMSASPGEFALMMGRGFTNDITSPYAWGTPGTSDANGMRWGTNTVEGTQTLNLGTLLDPNLQPYVYTDFDAAVDPGVTEYDAQGSLGDSGGGLFIYRSGVWELSGIAHLVDDGPNFYGSPDGGDNVTNPSEPGDFTGYSDVFAKSAQIEAITGTLIPEPSVISLTGIAALMLLRRRR